MIVGELKLSAIKEGEKMPNKPELTVETIYELWQKTYNDQALPDWSHLFPYYHDDITFQDSIQLIEGKEAFQQMCERLANRCQSLQMELSNVMKTNNIVMMEWKMTMSFRKSPDTPLYGCTRLILHDDGRIISQRDYYDLWGDIFNGIPLFGRGYRKILKRFFG